LLEWKHFLLSYSLSYIHIVFCKKNFSLFQKIFNPTTKLTCRYGAPAEYLSATGQSGQVQCFVIPNIFPHTRN
ncbi:hypothetical protein J7K19_07685, partial [bacterium]|nr:hypothetical protein [bacterium]